MQNDALSTKQTTASEEAASSETASPPLESPKLRAMTSEVTETGQKKAMQWKDHPRWGKMIRKRHNKMAKTEA